MMIRNVNTSSYNPLPGSSCMQMSEKNDKFKTIIG